MIDNLDLFILYFDLFGKNFPKSVKVSPDAFVQIAMQLAFYRFTIYFLVIDDSLIFMK
jgi:hypothetical protein